MSKTANRARKNTAEINMRSETAEGCRVTTTRTKGRHEITLETAPKVIGSIGPKGRDLSWLAGDVFSTDSAYRA